MNNEVRLTHPEIRLTQEQIDKCLSIYDIYDNDQKMSIVKCAFEMLGDVAPHHTMFVMARYLGYEIPKKWEHMYK